ncbi:hypothetical protein BGZ63DRAFT_392956 [Mariannaea sp. PMI_226]|nr:hypothetical protein BGZ63DRAFT_392956 [Mariannaea sp. PMI_226]
MATSLGRRSSSPPSLLLLPIPLRPLTNVALAAAYRGPLTTILSKLKASIEPSVLVVAAVCPILKGSSSRTKSVRWTEAQSLLAGLYTLVSVICAHESIDVDIGAGPGSVDVRIIFVDQNPSHEYAPNAEGKYEANCTTVLDLATFASTVHPWETVFHLDTKEGYELLNSFLGFAEKQSLSYSHLAVEGGVAIVSDTSDVSPTDDAKLGKVTCLGGTFDHLHPGHKLLLHATALLLEVPEKDSGDACTLIVGISGDELLVKKKYAEELQSWDERARSVLSFLSTLLEYNTTASSVSTVSKPDELVATMRNGTIKVRCVNLHDPFGPTISEEEMDLIVVSAETRGGGKAINDKRTEKGWKPLEVYEIDVLDAQEIVEHNDKEEPKKTEDFSAKISSTTIRQQRAAAKNRP